MRIAAGLYSVGEAGLSVSASWRDGSLVGGGPCAAAAASSAASCVQVATSRTRVTALASPPAAPVGRRAADGPSVRHETSPVVGFSWNRGRSRRHGRFRRSTYRTRFQVQNDLGKIDEEVHSTYISEVNTVGTKGSTQEIQLFRHGGGDSAKAGQGVSNPKLAQILVAYQRGFDQLSEMKCGLEDLGRVPLLSHVSWVEPVHAAPEEVGSGGMITVKCFEICHRCRWYQWQICRLCRWYRVAICRRCRWNRWCTLACEYLREFSKKFKTVLMWYSGAGGKLIHEKNRKQKISWHCPFKWGRLRLQMP